MTNVQIVAILLPILELIKVRQQRIVPVSQVTQKRELLKSALVINLSFILRQHDLGFKR
jgi:hypothetical protein